MAGTKEMETPNIPQNNNENEILLTKGQSLVVKTRNSILWFVGCVVVFLTVGQFIGVALGAVGLIISILLGDENLSVLAFSAYLFIAVVSAGFLFLSIKMLVRSIQLFSLTMKIKKSTGLKLKGRYWGILGFSLILLEVAIPLVVDYLNSLY